MDDKWTAGTLDVEEGNPPWPGEANDADDLAHQVRPDFPILQRVVRGHPLVYLDNAATSHKPLQVIEALAGFYRHSNANIHRGLHALAEEATAAYEEARAKIARFINAPAPENLVFTRGTTEAINLVASAWGRTALRPGDEIILTEMEHHSNLVPWQMLAQATGAVLRYLRVSDDGALVLDDLDRWLGKRTRLVALTAVSNVLGTVNPVAEIAARAHRSGALVLVDGAQAVPHMPVDVRAWDCDFLAFSGHKMLGPMGIGVLYAKSDVLAAMPPHMGGGDMIRKVTLEGFTADDPPGRFEAGTPNVAGAVALGAATDYLSRVGIHRVWAHTRALSAYAVQRLRSIEGVTVYGPTENRGGAVAFNVEGVHPHDLATYLDQQGIAIRAGHHCAQPLMVRLGVVATARASVYLYNLRAEIDALINGIEGACHFFGYVA